ncbi:MAG: hypothetical protein VX944_11040 [Myxococcota bacterium]|nr:hypothetical protein [Myxococcota bacterium]MEC9390599.1 hypothetical protein [Myxococcota bacterium]
MAVRSASYEFKDLTAFLTAYRESISQSSMFIEPGGIDTDVANEFKLDVICPLIGRQGPIPVQVVHRGPDGSIGLHIPSMPTSVQSAFDELLGCVEEIKAMLVASGEFIDKASHAKVLGQLAVAERVARDSGPAEAPQAAPKRRGRGIPIPDVSSMAPTLSGTMTDRSLRDAMVGFAVEKSTGLLTVKYPDGTTRYGYWLRGGPVGWRTEPLSEEEVLGVLLYKAEQITKGQVAESLEVMKAQGCRQGEALVEMGVLDFAQLIRVLGKQNEYILQRVMKDRKGEWTFHVLGRLPEQFLTPPLKVPALLFRALYSMAREMPGSELMEHVQPHMDRYLSIAPGSEHVFAELMLSKKENGFIDVVQSNSWRLREAYSVSPLGRGQTSALVWSLMELALLDMADQEDESRAKARVAERIERKKKSLQGNHFDVLELHWVCMKSEVNESYERLRTEFRTERFSGLDAKQIADLEAISARIEEAYAVLENDTGRRRYRADVIEKDAIVNSAEMLGRQGEMAIMRRDRAQACGAFAKAAELVPGEPSFRDGLRRATSI